VILKFNSVCSKFHSSELNLSYFITTYPVQGNGCMLYIHLSVNFYSIDSYNAFKYINKIITYPLPQLKH